MNTQVNFTPHYFHLILKNMLLTTLDLLSVPVPYNYISFKKLIYKISYINAAFFIYNSKYESGRENNAQSHVKEELMEERSQGTFSSFLKYY